MSGIEQGLLKRFLRGLFSKDHSFATGLLLALVIWTLTRIVDGVSHSTTVEYDISVAPDQLKDGRVAETMSITLSNLSTEAAVRDLQVAISPAGGTTFVDGEATCAFQSPAWGADAVCDARKDGANFRLPMLVPGTKARLTVRYLPGSEPGEKAAVMIRPSDSDAKMRLVKPGFETFVTQHQIAILLTLLALGAALLFGSIAAGLATTPQYGKDPDAPNV